VANEGDCGSWWHKREQPWARFQLA